LRAFPANETRFEAPSAITGLPNGSSATDTGPKAFKIALGAALSITDAALAYRRTWFPSVLLTQISPVAGFTNTPYGVLN
jgi:hypothetical protein